MHAIKDSLKQGNQAGKPSVSERLKNAMPGKDDYLATQGSTGGKQMNGQGGSSPASGAAAHLDQLAAGGDEHGPMHTVGTKIKDKVTGHGANA